MTLHVTLRTFYALKSNVAKVTFPDLNGLKQIIYNYTSASHARLQPCKQPTSGIFNCTVYSTQKPQSQTRAGGAKLQFSRFTNERRNAGPRSFSSPRQIREKAKLAIRGKENAIKSFLASHKASGGAWL